jgi:VIT1/CCC1 family predicted Fe2+/Mn2+ transporter
MRNLASAVLAILALLVVGATIAYIVGEVHLP